jgi:hypothetical protein
MLKIRSEQMAAMDQLALKQFEDRTVAELEQSFPKHARLLGKEKLSGIVHGGFERARAYGLKSRDGLRLFVELTLLLGHGFDLDPMVSWAAEILNDRETEEAARVERLFQKVTEYLQRVVGPDEAYLSAALEKVRREAPEGFAQSGVNRFEDYMLNRFLLLYPEKCGYVGEEALRRLVQNAVQRARRYGLTTERGATTLLGLMFLLGIGFDEDPKFEFASKVLNDASLADPNQKADRLRAEALEYLDKWRS